MSTKKNILQISVRADIGGGPEHLFGLVSGSKHEYNYTVAIPNDKPYFEMFTKLLGEENCIVIPHRKFEIGVLLRLRKIIKQREIGIIHSHGKGAGIYGRLLAMISGKRSVHTLHGFHIGEYNSIQKQAYIWLEKFLSRFTYRLIAVSEGERDQILNAGLCNTNKVVVIENGVEIPDHAISQNNFQSEPHRIISFSRFNYQKNTELIIHIALELRKRGLLERIQFEIFGEGEDFEKIEDLIKTNDLSASIKLKGSNPEARSKIVDGFCYISTSRWEGLPLSLLEAMAAGLPVIASDVVGNNNVISNEKDGLLFKLSSILDAVDAIQKLSESEELWKLISTNARQKIIDKYSLQQMIKKTKLLY